MAIYVAKDLNVEVRNDLTISDGDKEILTLEITNRGAPNIILSCCYKPPTGSNENLTTFVNNIFEKSFHEKKKCYLLGDYNINCFDYDDNEKVKNFYDSLYEQGTIPLVNKPTRVTLNSASLIDNIITNDIINNSSRKGIIKSDISDHFPIFISVSTSKTKTTKQSVKILKRDFNDRNMTSFKEQLSLLHWNHIDLNTDVNLIYETFLETFSDIYDANFPLKEYSNKENDIKSPWITKGIKKSSKRK